MSLNKLLKGKYPIGVYYQSWSANWASDPSNIDLSNIPDPINVVFISFANPNCSYKSGAYSWSGTGIDFSSDFIVVKGAIKLLQKRGIVVMLAVGGATYPFTTFNATNLAVLANDLGVDGIDIDWEPAGGASESNKLGPIIQQMRSVYPNGLLSLASFSVGCYGQGEFANATPSSGNTGMNIAGLQSNGNQLDFVNLMSYDASPVYDPLVGFKSVRKYFSGPILIGAEVPPEAWGGHVLTLSEVESYTKCAIDDKTQINGLFVWSYQKPGTPSCMDVIKTANNIFQNSNPSPPQPTPQPQPIPQPQPTPQPQPEPIPQPTPNVENWVSGKSYKKGDSVLYEGIKYTCSIDILSCPPGSNCWSTITPTPTPTPYPTPCPSPVSPSSPIQSNTWSVWKPYSVGQIVSYNGKNYKCIQGHTTQPGWYPDIVPALWSIV